MNEGRRVRDTIFDEANRVQNHAKVILESWGVTYPFLSRLLLLHDLRKFASTTPPPAMPSNNRTLLSLVRVGRHSIPCGQCVGHVFRHLVLVPSLKLIAFSHQTLPTV